MLNNHLEDCKKQAKAIIQKQVDAAVAYHDGVLLEREKCLKEKEWPLPHKFTKRGKYDPHIEKYRSQDPAWLSLHAICVKDPPVTKVKYRPGSKKTTFGKGNVQMPLVRLPPKYDAWVPVQVNYWAGKELNVEPYMPFLGDQDQDCELAFEVFEDMADDAGKDIDVSDGEVNRDGTFNLPRDDIERTHYYSMPQARWREGSRKSILAVVDMCSKWDDNMWRILSTTLGFKEIRRTKAVAKVAQERRQERQLRRTRRARQKRSEQALVDLFDKPYNEAMPIDDGYSAHASANKHFCFVCNVFRCLQHETFDIEPVVPIEDEEAVIREELLSSRKATACSKDCFLEKNVVLDLDRDEWTAEEILMLREAVPMFGLDPCSLALVIGSRSCKEVELKLQDPLEAEIANYDIQKARKPYKAESSKKKVDGAEKGTGKKIGNKTVVEVHDSSAIDQDFTPCCHTGPCTIENCSCVKSGLHCESTCGCHCGRNTQWGLNGGIAWTPAKSDSPLPLLERRCSNLHEGCDCQDGNCNGPSCPCWEQNRACSADTCGCDVNLLPQKIHKSKRRCRNIPITCVKHKRTFMGKSDVHGFGLFAGERFEEGDLVGIYSGQLIDTRLADMIGRLYDATDRTYIFNVTESLVIDGGLLGSKAKFCNHTKPGAKENCASRLVRVRGDAYVALFCKRPVETGEEFLFDYRFTGEVPTWAKDDPKGKGKK